MFIPDSTKDMKKLIKSAMKNTNNICLFIVPLPRWIQIATAPTDAFRRHPGETGSPGIV
jgi:hypothetical protein